MDLLAVGVISSFLTSAAFGVAWFLHERRHRSKCSWYKVHEADVMEIRDALWDLNHKGYGLVEIHRVDPSNLYRVRP
jgi:hypothetical protein